MICEQSPLFVPLADFSNNKNCSAFVYKSQKYRETFIYIDNFKTLSDKVSPSEKCFLTLNEINHYDISVEVKLRTKSEICCANDNITLNIYDVTNEKVLASSPFINGSSIVSYRALFKSETKIGFTIDGLNCSTIIKCLNMTGNVKDSPRLKLLDKVIEFDTSRKYRYIPLNPNLPDPPYGPQYPTPTGNLPSPPYPPNTLAPQSVVQFGWQYNVIPHVIDQQPQPNGYIDKPKAPVPTNPPLPDSIDKDAYHKLNSISSYLPYCIGFTDPINLDPNDPRVTVFASDLENRGVNNYRKKVYMSALTADLMPNYAEKIDVFLNEIYTVVTNYATKPALSVFKEALVRFFLAMHVGYDNYPDYVIEYFTRFTDAVGLGIPADAGDITEAFLNGVIYCNITIDCVNKYFFDRYNIIRQTKDMTTLLYYWNLAGLPKEAIISEALHNMIAFNQFLNVFYLMIRDQYGVPYNLGTPVPVLTLLPPPNPPFIYKTVNYFFIKEFCAAVSNKDKLNVIREFYRLTVPNSASFSRLQQVPNDPNVVVQSRHVHQAIMFQSDPVGYSKYNTDKYANFKFDFNSAMTSECPPPVCPKCPYLVPINPLKNIDPEVKLTQSTIDNETVIERRCSEISDPGKAFPVYANKVLPLSPIPAPINIDAPGPIYTPFGLGYRRCAGEMFSYFVTIKLFERFKSIPFLFGPVDPNKHKITVAPFTEVPDNIFFDPTGTVVC